MADDKKYYLNINDQNVGPLTIYDIAQRLKDGLIHDNDYIFVSGDTEWYTIKQRPELLQYLNNADLDNKKVWFIRKDHKNDGPYSKEDLFNMINMGQIDINDYVWSNEIRNWTTIKEVFDLGLTKDNTPNLEEPAIDEKANTKKLNTPEILLGALVLLAAVYKAKDSVLTALLLTGVGLAILFIGRKSK